MKRLVTLLIALTVLAPVFADDLHDVFEGYRACLLAQDGAGVLKYLDSETIQYYGTSITDALYLDRPSLEKKSIIDKIMVLRLRVHFSTEALLSMTGADLLVLSVNNGWIEKSSVSTTVLDPVSRITGTEGCIEVLSNNKGSGTYFWFNQEESGWKLNLARLFPQSNDYISQYADLLGLSPDELVEFLVGQVEKRKITDLHWEPLVTDIAF